MTAYIDEDFSQNEDFTSETITIENPDGTLANLAGATATLDARYGSGETATLALQLTSGAGQIVLNVSDSTAYYKVTAAQALSMTPGTINYTMKCLLASGAQSLPIKGVWRLAASEA